MASAFSHAIVAAIMGKASVTLQPDWRILLLGMSCATLPDLDVVGFAFGVQYGDLWGHRGLTHSLFFAALLAAILTASVFRRAELSAKVRLFGYLFLCTASHGVLDAITDGGLGVAFFSPFDTERYFFAFRPVRVSPIGVGPFLSQRGLAVLVSEVIWIWLPAFALVAVVKVIRKVWSR